VLELLLDDGGHYSRASKVQALVSELQEEICNCKHSVTVVFPIKLTRRSSAHGVNGLLRDKLHNHSSQRAQANEGIWELEGLGELVEILKGEIGATNSRREELRERFPLLIVIMQLTSVASQWKGGTADGAADEREEKTVAVLADAVGLENRLTLADSK
jgi:hypothetical protein